MATYLMPGRNGMEVILELRQHDIPTRILVFSILARAGLAAQLIRQGAAGYLGKDAATSELSAAVRSVAAGHSWLGHSMAPRMADRVSMDPDSRYEDALTRRELQVLLRYARGRTSPEVSSDLGIAPSTVANHRKSIADRLGLTNAAHMALFAAARHLIFPDEDPFWDEHVETFSVEMDVYRAL
jgi:two-component system, NarL family, invasion response regulator UvrY